MSPRTISYTGAVPGLVMAGFLRTLVNFGVRITWSLGDGSVEMVPIFGSVVEVVTTVSGDALVVIEGMGTDWEPNGRTHYIPVADILHVEVP